MEACPVSGMILDSEFWMVTCWYNHSWLSSVLCYCNVFLCSVFPSEFFLMSWMILEGGGRMNRRGLNTTWQFKIDKNTMEQTAQKYSFIHINYLVFVLLSSAHPTKEGTIRKTRTWRRKFVEGRMESSWRRRYTLQLDSTPLLHLLCHDICCKRSPVSSIDASHHATPANRIHIWAWVWAFVNKTGTWVAQLSGR